MRSFFAGIASWFKRMVARIFHRDAEDNTEAKPVEPDEIICYYGCPNSKKAKALQLGKRRITE